MVSHEVIALCPDPNGRIWYLPKCFDHVSELPEPSRWAWPNMREPNGWVAALWDTWMFGWYFISRWYVLLKEAVPVRVNMSQQVGWTVNIHISRCRSCLLVLSQVCTPKLSCGVSSSLIPKRGIPTCDEHITTQKTCPKVGNHRENIIYTGSPGLVRKPGSKVHDSWLPAMQLGNPTTLTSEVG